jgi:hypothetical protein
VQRFLQKEDDPPFPLFPEKSYAFTPIRFEVIPFWQGMLVENSSRGLPAEFCVPFHGFCGNGSELTAQMRNKNKRTQGE